jgi:hypothetical protein
MEPERGLWRIGIRSFDGLRYYNYALREKTIRITQPELGSDVSAGS